MVRYTWEELQEAAHQGDVLAMLLMGILYWNGTGVEKNFDTSMMWLERVCEVDEYPTTMVLRWIKRAGIKEPIGKLYRENGQCKWTDMLLFAPIEKVKECLAIVTKRNWKMSGGHGTSFEDAIVIEETSEAMGVELEHQLVRLLYDGKPRIVGQTLAEHNGSLYDVLEVVNRDDAVRKLYFNIDSFFGKTDAPF